MTGPDAVRARVTVLSRAIRGQAPRVGHRAHSTIYSDMVTGMASSTAAASPLHPAASPRRVAVNLVIARESLDAFDRLASGAGLSRPKMFDRLMAVEAQRLRLEADIEQMDRADPADADPELSEWVETNRADSDL